MTVNHRKPIKYLKLRIKMLEEELAKNPSDENTMIIGKSISELSIVLDLLERSVDNKWQTPL